LELNSFVYWFDIRRKTKVRVVEDTLSSGS